MLTWKDLKRENVIPLNISDAEAITAVDYKEQDNFPPIINFTYARTMTISLESAEVDFLREKAPNLEIMKDKKNPGKFYCWGTYGKIEKKGVEMIRVFKKSICNYRRIMWGCADGHNAKEKYKGVEYVDRSQDGGLTTTSSAELIRDSFIRFLATADIPPKIKYHYAVRDVLDKLLKDAIENQISAAQKAVGTNLGYEGRIKVNGIVYK